MAQIEIQVPSGFTAKFDAALSRYLVAELTDRPEIDVSITALGDGSASERRLIYMSCENHLRAFEHHWRLVAG